MLRVFKPTSPMTLGTWCLTVYSLPLTVAAALSLLPAGGPALEWVRKAAVALGVLPALGSAVYKGVLLSTNAQLGLVVANLRPALSRIYTRGQLARLAALCV